MNAAYPAAVIARVTERACAATNPADRAEVAARVAARAAASGLHYMAARAAADAEAAHAEALSHLREARSVMHLGVGYIRLERRAFDIYSRARAAAVVATEALTEG